MDNNTIYLNVKELQKREKREKIKEKEEIYYGFRVIALLNEEA